MISERACAYSEVYAILQLMDQKYINKIPHRLQEIIIEEMDKNYKPNIVPDTPLKEQPLHQKTFTILAMINLNYWCEDTKCKEELIEIYTQNEKNKIEEMQKKFNPDNLFKK